MLLSEHLHLVIIKFLRLEWIPLKEKAAMKEKNTKQTTAVLTTVLSSIQLYYNTVQQHLLVPHHQYSTLGLLHCALIIFRQFFNQFCKIILSFYRRKKIVAKCVLNIKMCNFNSCLVLVLVSKLKLSGESFLSHSTYLTFKINILLLYLLSSQG